MRIARDGTLLYINKGGLNLLPEWHLQIGQAAPSILHEAALQAIDNGSIQVLHLEHGQRKFSFTVGPVVAAGYANLYGDDITERKQAEEKLKASEDKYRGIFENAVEGIYQAKPEGRYISVNPALARMLGYESPEEMITSVTDVGRQLFVNSEDLERYQAIAEKQGEVKSFEAQLYRKDGSATWTSTNARAIRDAAGNISHFEGTVKTSPTANAQKKP